jgi:plastocyanin
VNGRMQRFLLFGSLFMAAWPATPAAAGGGCHSAGPESAQPMAGTTVEMVGNCFLPGVLTVDPGTTVRFANQDDIAHVVLGTGWGSGEAVAPGKAVEHRFEQPGTFGYSCYLHPGMNGAIVVGQAAVRPATAATPAALASSSTASDGVGFGLLALGGLGGAVLGAVGTRRLKPGRDTAH